MVQSTKLCGLQRIYSHGVAGAEVLVRVVVGAEARALVRVVVGAQ
jgi:hypothetical protein